MRRVAAILVGLLLSGGAMAATLDGVTMPDQTVAAGQTLTLNGIGVRTLTVFSVKVYVAGLYLAAPSHDAQQILQSTTPKVLVLHFLHAGSKADIEKEYRLGESNNCGHGECDPADAADFDRLVAAAPAVAVGDTSTYVVSAAGLQVLANGRTVMESRNTDLARRILVGFIGDHPPSAELRSALLGLRAE